MARPGRKSPRSNTLSGSGPDRQSPPPALHPDPTPAPQPPAPPPPAPAPARATLPRLWTRLIEGPAHKDPLYLSNRTWQQRLRLGLVVSAPVVIVLGVAAYAMFAPPPQADRPPAELSAAEIAARTAVVPKDFALEQNNDLQIVEAAVDLSESPHRVVGVVRNNTSRRFQAAELAFELTDEQGSRVGAVGTRTGNVEPHASVPFRFSIVQRNARLVFVRDVRGAF